MRYELNFVVYLSYCFFIYGCSYVVFLMGCWILFLLNIKINDLLNFVFVWMIKK